MSTMFVSLLLPQVRALGEAVEPNLQQITQPGGGQHVRQGHPP